MQPSKEQYGSETQTAASCGVEFWDRDRPGFHTRIVGAHDPSTIAPGDPHGYGCCRCKGNLKAITHLDILVEDNTTLEIFRAPGSSELILTKRGPDRFTLDNPPEDLLSQMRIYPTNSPG